MAELSDGSYHYVGWITVSGVSELSHACLKSIAIELQLAAECLTEQPGATGCHTRDIEAAAAYATIAATGTCERIDFVQKVLLEFVNRNYFGNYKTVFLPQQHLPVWAWVVNIGGAWEKLSREDRKQEDQIQQFDMQCYQKQRQIK